MPDVTLGGQPITLHFHLPVGYPSEEACDLSVTATAGRCVMVAHYSLLTAQLKQATLLHTYMSWGTHTAYLRHYSLLTAQLRQAALAGHVTITPMRIISAERVFRHVHAVCVCVCVCMCVCVCQAGS